MYRNWERSIVMGCVLMAASLPAVASGKAAPMPVVKSRNLARTAAVAPVAGKRVRLEGIRKAGTGETVAFELERFEVFTPGAKVTVHGPHGDEVLPPPANAYFRGAVAGKADSRVFLAVLADGRAQGIVNEGEASYLIGGEDEPGVKSLAMRRVDLESLKASRGEGFSCDNELLPPGRTTLDGLDFTASAPVEKSLTGITEKIGAYTARVAIETDYEFFTRFNDATLATTYIGNLIGYASILYQAEINTNLAVSSVSLWSTSADPWSQTTAKCGLMELGRYWNKNNTGVPRTIAHFLSGKATGGGVAWVGVLCSGAFGASASCTGIPTDAPWGGGYGFTGGITGTFNALNPTVMWDIFSVAHEIGHNFNSPHTHCYNGIGGNASPVDQCYSGESGCYAGTRTLPGATGAGSGTIMSYCHLLGGGYNNIALTFGTNHPYGVAPGRVPSRMNAYVAAKNVANPACLAP